MSQSKRDAVKVEYIPPLRTEVQAYAKIVCEKLAEKSGNADFTKSETIDGLAEFLHVLLTIEAKRRNAAQVDSAD